MQNLVEDLLTYSRVETQGRPFTTVDLNVVTQDVIEDLDEMIQRTQALIRVGELPTMSADPSQIRQLIQNLIVNALKFRREDVPPVVDITGEVRAGMVRLVVRDNGIGFDPQYSNRIFRVFERLHGRSAYPGTGIGLALCRKIAERHGGTVAAYAEPEQGATFTVTLQAQRTEAVSDDGPPADPPLDPGWALCRRVSSPAGRSRSWSSTMTRTIASWCAMPLQAANLGEDMRFAVDGQDLLDYLRHEGRWTGRAADAPRPAIILMDLNMPRKDGREALSEIKRDDSLRRIPVVVLSTSRDAADVRSTYDLGASSYITKPATFAEFTSVMRTWTQYWFEVVELPPGEPRARRAR